MLRGSEILVLTLVAIPIAAVVGLIVWAVRRS
jgi:hypothetical protein